MLGLLALILTWWLGDMFFPQVGQGSDGTVYAFWNYAIPIVTSLASTLLNRNSNKNKDSGPSDSQSQLSAQESKDRTRGNAAEDQYLGYLDNYDAGGAAKETAGAMSQDWMKTFSRQIESLRGNQVSRGRLDTGYGMQDEDRYVTDFQDNVAKNLSALSMDAERMNTAAARDRGALGERMTGRSVDLAATRRDQELTDAASKRSMYGGVASSLLQAGGRALGSYLNRPQKTGT